MPKKTFFWLFRLRRKKKEELASCASSRFNFEYILMGRNIIFTYTSFNFVNHVETIGIN